METRRRKQIPNKWLLSLLALGVAGAIMWAAVEAGKAQRVWSEAFARDRIRSWVVDQSAGAQILTDSEFHVIDWSASASRLFGYSASEMIGQSPILIIPLKHHEKHTDEEVWREAPLDGRFYRVYCEAVHKNGQSFPVSVRIQAIVMPNGAKVLYALIIPIANDVVRHAPGAD